MLSVASYRVTCLRDIQSIQHVVESSLLCAESRKLETPTLLRGGVEQLTGSCDLFDENEKRIHRMEEYGRVMERQ